MLQHIIYSFIPFYIITLCYYIYNTHFFMNVTKEINQRLFKEDFDGLTIFMKNKSKDVNFKIITIMNILINIWLFIGLFFTGQDIFFICLIILFYINGNKIFSYVMINLLSILTLLYIIYFEYVLHKHNSIDEFVKLVF